MVRPILDLDRMATSELLRRGIAAARVGEAGEARSLLDEATRREPEDADAWLWLGSVAATPQEKRDAFERVLRLRPGDTEASAGLERLAEKYGRGVLDDRDEDLESLRCTWHADRETMLRCSRCNKPMCPGCARQHPVGLRCKDCMRELRSPLYKVSGAQLIGGLVTGAVAWAVAAVVLASLPLFFLFTIFLAIAAGPMIADLISRGAGRKRGRSVQLVAIVSLVIGLGMLWIAGLAGVMPLLLDPMTSLILAGFGGSAAWRRLV